MAGLIDFFGLLTVLLHGAAITAQSVLLGSMVFLVGLAAPLKPRLGSVFGPIEARARRWIRIAGLAFCLVVLLNAALEISLLGETAQLGLGDLLGAQFVTADFIAVAAAVVLVVLARIRLAGQALVLAPIAGTVLLAAVVATSHAAARLDHQISMGAASFFHQLGGAVWLGGLPCFLFALKVAHDPRALAAIGRRYSLISMVGVTMILIGAVALGVVYIGSFDAILGTAYGAMAAGKTVMFLCLLLLGLGNYLTVERMRRGGAVSALRIRRFAEVEFGVGIAIFFAASSITSLPPAVDLTEDRVTWAEIAERMTPAWPRLSSPDHQSLAIPALQAKLDGEWAAARKKAETRPQAFIPGEGELPPRNAEDIAWSEYNHHWAGLFVILIAIAALLERSGKVPIARHWPLLFLGLAAFLFVRSDPETWPMGDIGFIESMRDPEVVQHRFFVVLIIAFSLFEWRVRNGGFKAQWPAMVFPILTAAGGAALLTHSHAIANIKEQLLIELTHLPLAIFGIAAGWARWLELRLPGREGRIAGWLWPVFFLLVGVILVIYREA